MELHIGDVFEHRGVKLMVIESAHCHGCYFFGRDCRSYRKNTGDCGSIPRNDTKFVMFVPVEDI